MFRVSSKSNASAIYHNLIYIYIYLYYIILHHYIYIYIHTHPRFRVAVVLDGLTCGVVPAHLRTLMYRHGPEHASVCLVIKAQSHDIEKILGLGWIRIHSGSSRTTKKQWNMKQKPPHQQLQFSRCFTHLLSQNSTRPKSRPTA